MMLKINSWLWGLIFGITVSQSLAQDLFDCEHSARYANYLYSSEEYTKAANEYERLLINCDSSIFVSKLLTSYRLSGQYKQLDKRINELYTGKQQVPNFVQLESIKLALLTEHYQRTDSLLEVSTINHNVKTYYKLKRSVLTNEWFTAQHQLLQLDTGLVSDYRNWFAIINTGKQYRKKSPSLAATMSTLLPGLGRIYTHDWKDALVSALFVGGLSYQAYRSFNRYPNGLSGWIFVTMSAGFYVGNIYGSYKSALQYNQRRLTSLHNEAKRLSFQDF